MAPFAKLPHHEVAKIIEQARLQGITKTYSQVQDEYATALSRQSIEQSSGFGSVSPDTMATQVDRSLADNTLMGPSPEPQTFEGPQFAPGGDDPISDFAKGTLWGALDTALFGLPGLGWQSMDPDSYDEFQQDIGDTSAGRIGQAAGAGVGFLLPMGWVGKGVNLGARGIAKLAGKSTVRSAQRKAGETILKNKAVRKGLIEGSENVTSRQALNIGKDLSDDLIGFGALKRRIFTGGNAYKMEHSAEFAGQIKNQMTATMGSRINDVLKLKGVNLKPKELQRLSDEVVEILSTKPVSSLEGLISGIKQGSTIGHVAGAVLQEAVTFGITGTMMDYVSVQRGDLQLKPDEDYWTRALHHGMVGGALGLTKILIPGGKDAPVWQDVLRATGLSTKNVNRKIAKMSHSEVTALARTTLRNDDSFAIIGKNGKAITEKHLRDGLVSKENTALLKDALIGNNKKLLSDFRSSPFIRESIRDIAESAPRMTTGSLIMNQESILDGQFEQLTPEEMVFHLTLGAIMTKRGRPLFPKQSGMFGARDYYYNSDISDIVVNMRHISGNVDHIGKIGKEFTGNAATDIIERMSQNPDIEAVIRVLKDRDIMYDKNEHKKVTKKEGITPDGTGDIKRDHVLLEMLGPISDILLSRGLEMNPNIKYNNMVEARKEIGKIESQVLSTADNIITLGDQTLIRKSRVQGNEMQWNLLERDIFTLVREAVGIMTGNRNHLSKETGEMIELNWNSMKDPGFVLNTPQTKTLRTLQDLLVLLGTGPSGTKKIKTKEMIIDQERGFSVELSKEKIDAVTDLINAWEGSYGQIAYGESMGLPVKVTDPSIWSELREVNFIRNTENVFDVIVGKDTGNISPELSKDINRLIYDLFSKAEGNNDIARIVDNPNKIVPTKESLESAIKRGDHAELEDFKKIIYKILSTNKKADVTGSNFVKKGGQVGAHEVDYDQIKVLKEKLVQAGMPDISVFSAGSGHMQDWVDRIVLHGVMESTRGLEMTPYQGTVVNRLMQEGLISVFSPDGKQGTRLEAPIEITESQVRNALGPDAKPAQVKEYIKSYDNVLKELGDLVVKRQDYGVNYLNIDQLSTIVVADRIFNQKKLESDLIKEIEPVQLAIVKLQEEHNLLKTSYDKGLDSTNNPLTKKDSETVRARMEFVQSKMSALAEFEMAFLRATGGFKEISRSASYVNYIANMPNKEGFTLREKLKQLAEAESEAEFKGIRAEIKDLQKEIALKINNRIDVTTSMEEMRNNDVARRMEEDIIEGRLDQDNKNVITSEQFLANNNVTITDLQNAGIISSLQTFDSPGQALNRIYQDTAHMGNVQGFFDKLVQIRRLKKERGPLSNKFKDEVLKLFHNFERNYQIKRLQLDLTSGKGTFETTNMSQGFLTDLYSDIFLNGDQMVLLSNQVTQNGKIKSILNQSDMRVMLESSLNSSDFFASKKKGYSHYQKFFVEGRKTEVGPKTQKESQSEKTQEWYQSVKLNDEMLEGSHYIVGVDENINIVLGRHQFNDLAKSFVEWYQNPESGGASKYVKTIARGKNVNAKELMNTLKDYYDRLEALKSQEGYYDVIKFAQSSKIKDTDQLLSTAFHKMFSVMYASRVDGDWLNDAYFDGPTSYKSFKYKRLSQNQGYVRNSKAQGELLKIVYGKDSKYKEIVNKYAEKENINHLVIDDSFNSKTGENINRLITDNRSQAEDRLRIMRDEGKIDKETYDFNLELLKKNNSVNAEGPNGASIVRREFLDYNLLKDGQAGVIGTSPGIKPVGLTSYTDANGIIHVFNNKTHYFYDSRFDSFFKNNPDIDVIAFKSGAKKSKKIDPNTGNDLFVPYGRDAAGRATNIPVVGENNLTNWINNIKVNASHESVMPVKQNQTVNGTIYGSPHEAKIIKQFPNWGSESLNAEVYKWGRIDAANQFNDISIKLLDPERIDLARGFAKDYYVGKEEKGRFITTDSEHTGLAQIWIEANGVPFSAASKNLYDKLIMSKYVENAGVFDGYTDMGGTAILRPDFDMKLNIPIFKNDANGIRRQVVLGEANIGSDYLNRDIHFTADYGVAYSAKESVKQRPFFKSTGTLTVAFNKGGRDILVDLKKLDVYDPLSPKVKSVEQLPKEIKDAVTSLKRKIREGEIVKMRNLYQELTKLTDVDGSIVIQTNPAPRVGPHDAIVAKIKGITPTKDGSVMELNSFDITSRAQRDYDTDKMPFYMDTPFRILKEAYKESGPILEPLPMESSMKDLPSFDPFDQRSFLGHQAKVNAYKRYRGDVVKMQRKLSYAEILFKGTGGVIELGGGVQLEFFPVRDKNNGVKAKQRSTSDGQNVLDIYAGFPAYMENMKTWTDATLYGNSSNPNMPFDVNTIQPYFNIRKKNTISGEYEVLPVTEPAHKLIIEKLLGDYGRVLQLESNIWMGGESMSPRYSDYAARFKDFKLDYSPDRVNHNFYNYLLKKGIAQEVVDNIFRPDKNKPMVDVMSPIANVIKRNPTAFLKSLDAILHRDLLEVTEIKHPSGDYFNKGIDKLIGESRAEALEVFRLEGSDVNVSPEKRNVLIESLWDAFNKHSKDEQRLVQINNIEAQIRRKERLLSRDESEGFLDQAQLSLEKENLLILNGAKESLINLMSLEPGFGGQKLRTYNPKGNNTVFATNKTGPIVIRNSKTGDYIVKIKQGDSYDLKKNQTAVENPVILKAVREHDLLDAVAFANTTLGYYAHVAESDLSTFRNVVRETQKGIKNSMSKIMKQRGYRDWELHQANVDLIIKRGLDKIHEQALRNEPLVDGEIVDTFMGKLPKHKATYGLDFLMAMLTPDYTGNMNEYYYSPKTNGFMPAVKAPSKSVINAVFKAIDYYKAVPDYKAFVSDFAQTHGAFYEANLGGRGFNSALKRLTESTFEGALLSQTVDKALNNPFLSRKDYKDMKEWTEYNNGVNAQFAELYRQIIQEGAMTDPGTMFRLREQMIKQFGMEAYESMMMQARGQIVHDGISSRQYSGNSATGKVIGEVLIENPSAANRRISGVIPSTKGQRVIDKFDKVIGQSNFKKKSSDGC